MNSRVHSSGNVLFLILICVGLFALLSYAVTNSSRTSTSSISKEKADLHAAEILNYMMLVDQAIQRMLITGKCNPSQLNPYNSVYQMVSGALINATANTNAPPDGHCDIWSGEYGITPRIFPLDAYETLDVASSSWKPGHLGLRVTRVVDVGTPLNDLVISTRNLKRQVCLSLIERLDLQVSDIPVETNVSTNSNFSNLDVTIANPLGDEETALAGKHVFPMTGSTTNNVKCNLYFVFLPR